MRKFIFILLLSIPALSFAQVNPYAEVDKYVMSVPQNIPLDSLAARLTAPFHSDSEKVRAIFYWITQNIGYDVVKYHQKGTDKYTITYSGATDSAEAEEEWLNKYAEGVFLRRAGLCEGYASLFKTLCDRSKLSSVVVHGEGKNSLQDIGAAYDDDHAWNAVQINGTWRLIDACWASGYCSGGTTIFHKEFDEYYYFTPPEIFAYKHYPNDSNWLIGEVISKDKFIYYPYVFRNSSQNTVAFTPQNGIIKAHIGDIIRIEIEIDKTDDRSLYKGSEIDEFDAHDKEIRPPKQLKKLQAFKVEGNHLSYDYKVWSKSVKVLYVAYNLKYLLAYKLEVVK